MNANIFSRKIEMSKAEAKAAGKIGSEKFEELRQYMNEFPGFEIQIKAPAKRKVELKGLDYKYMRNYSTLVIIFLDCTGESIFRHHFSINRTEQIVFGCATTNAHVFRQYLCHLAAQRNRLQFPCFGMTVDHTLVRQRNIPVLNVADCSRAATRID